MSKQLQVKDKIETDKTIKIAPFKKDIRTTLPHKHNNYFEIIYLSKGSGFHYIDSRKYEVQPPVLYFVRKEQVHYWELDTEPDGFVVIIKRSFIDKSLDNELKNLLTRISRQNHLYVNDTSVINTLLALLVEENRSEAENSFHIIEGLLKALLAKLLDVSKPGIELAAAKSDLYQSFLDLLSAGQIIKNTVHYYAEQLNTTPQNLNTACRKAVNQSVTEVLAEFIISESKRLLHYTSNTVSEIAFALDFIDASHFVKYFKRITGQTPLQFRQNSQ